MSGRPRWAPLIVLAVLFGVLSAWSWGRWPDPLVDFGRELYVPWQLATGKVLYRDIASLFGPLSSYVNALWFVLFGVSLTTLVAANLVILAVLTAAIFLLIEQTTDRATALIGSAVVVMMFGFSQYVGIGNYNYVTPYSHEATHGITLVTLMLVALSSATRKPRVAAFAAAGFCFGLTALTKPEILLAATSAATVGFAAMWMDRRTRFRDLAAFLTAAAIPATAFFLYFSTHMGAWPAALALATPWTGVLGSEVTRNRFYLQGMGLDDPWSNSARMLGMFAIVTLFVGGLAVADVVLGRVSVPARLRKWSEIAGPPAILLLAINAPWPELPRAMPLLVLVIFAAGAVAYMRARRAALDVAPSIVLVMSAAAAMALLAKMALNARLYHYGFYLAMPATLLVVVMLVRVIPSLLEDRWRRGALFRSVALLVIVAGVAFHVARSHTIYRRKTLTIARGGDAFKVFGADVQWQGKAAVDALALIERTVPRNQTLAVLPDGVMLNYLSRRANPTPYFMWSAPEQLIYGEDRALAAYQRTPPDYIAIVHVSAADYGVSPFGTDPWYGRGLRRWIDSEYTSIATVGQDARNGERTGVELLARKTAGGP